MGHNFADGAGNFEGYLGYRRTSPITADHRDHAACVLDNNIGASSGASFAPYVCGGSSNSAPAVFYNQQAFASDQVCDPALGCTTGPRRRGLEVSTVSTTPPRIICSVSTSATPPDSLAT